MTARMRANLMISTPNQSPQIVLLLTVSYYLLLCVHILNKMRETLHAMYVVLTQWLCLIVFHLLLVDIPWCLAEGSVQRSCAAPPGPDGMPIYFHPVEVLNGHLKNYAFINNNLFFISDDMIMKLKRSNSERSYLKNIFFLLLFRHFPIQSR